MHTNISFDQPQLQKANQLGITKDLLFETEEHCEKFDALLFKEVLDECHKIGMEALNLFEGKNSEDGSKTAQNLYQMNQGAIDPK